MCGLVWKRLRCVNAVRVVWCVVLLMALVCDGQLGAEWFWCGCRTCAGRCAAVLDIAEDIGVRGLGCLCVDVYAGCVVWGVRTHGLCVCACPSAGSDRDDRVDWLVSLCMYTGCVCGVLILL